MCSKIVYQNWIVDIGLNPETISSNRAAVEIIYDDELTHQIRQAVSSALDELDEDECEILIRRQYMGESYRQISDTTGRSAHNLTSLHNRGLKKLRSLLEPFVEATFGIAAAPAPGPACPICSSIHVDQLNRIISNRDRRKTWKPVLTLLRQKYNIVITSPQLLVGHVKYHQFDTPRPDPCNSKIQTN